MKKLEKANQARHYAAEIKKKTHQLNILKSYVMNSKKKKNMQLSDNSPETSPIANFPGGNSFCPDGVAIFNEIGVDIKRSPKQRRYSPIFKTFAMGLLLISYPCYTYLRSKLPFFSQRLLMKNFGTSLSFEYQKLTYIEIISSVTRNYREKENLSDSEVIDVVLAVDAISFNPVLKVGKNGTVYGTTKQEDMDGSCW